MIQKVWFLVELYRLGDERTTAVPSNQPCIVIDDGDHERVGAILTAQYRASMRSKLA